MVLSAILISCIVAAASSYIDSTIQKKWKVYSEKGNYDSIVNTAKPLFYEACVSGDRESAMHAAVMTAQGYLFSAKVDSVYRWISVLDSLGVDQGNLQIRSIYYNMRAIFALKLKMDYSEALQYFLKGYEVATEYGSHEYRVILLTNIANVYYLRQDSSGMRFAEDAYRIADSCQVSEFAECLALLAMAQMFCLKQDYQSSMIFVKASDTLSQYGAFSLRAPIEVLYGDIYSAWRNYGEAEIHYKEALGHIYDTEPGMVSLIYLNYGKCCEMQGKVQEAVRLYEQGLDVSRQHGNMEFRRELLKRLTDVYCDLNDLEMFKYYYMQYSASSLSMADREREFNSLILSNQEIRHKLDIQTRELALLKARRNTLLGYLISFTALVLLTSFVYLWRKQKKMYRILVDQYCHYIEQSERITETAPDSGSQDDGSEAEKILFEKVKALMVREKLFRQKDLTLDRVAEMVGSNRTYVSKVINRYAGQSFPAYLNMYRIAEAVRLISNFELDMPLKQIAEEVGFASMSVFYNAFCKETGMPPGRYRKELQNRKNVS